MSTWGFRRAGRGERRGALPSVLFIAALFGDPAACQPESIVTAVPLERFHSQYRELHAELLARPFPVVSGHVMVAHRAILFTAEEAEGHRAAIAALARFRGGGGGGRRSRGFRSCAWVRSICASSGMGSLRHLPRLRRRAACLLRDRRPIFCRPAGWRAFRGASWRRWKSPATRRRRRTPARRRRWSGCWSTLPRTGLVGGWVVERVASV